MSIRFMCPDCRVVLSIAAKKAGSQIVCPHCKLPVIVPQPARQPQLGIMLEDAVPSSTVVERDWKAAPPPIREPQSDQHGDSRNGPVIQSSGKSDADVRIDAPIGDCEELPLATRRPVTVAEPVSFKFSSPIDRAEDVDDVDDEVDEENRFDEPRVSTRKNPGAARNNMPPIRNLIAFALTVGSFVFIAIGLMRFHTKYWLAYLLVALCLAIASLAVLYVGKRRRRYRG